MSDCEHDWRINPFVTLPTNPPKARLVCATCGALSSTPYTFAQGAPRINEPLTWPHWTQDARLATLSRV